MKKGIVKEYDSSKGFGFITGDDNEDYFVHVSRDEMVLPAESEIAFELFSDAGFKVQLQTPSVSHKIPLQTKDIIEKFILETQ